jgi:WD40 repeat protein
MEGESFANRYYPFGHGGYFEVRNGDPDQFMKEQWVPLLTSDRPIQPTPPRDAPTPLVGVLHLLIDNAEAVKVLMYVLPLVATVLWIDGLRQEAVSRELAANSDFLLQSRPDRLETAALLAAHSMRRRPVPESERELRLALSLLPRKLPPAAEEGLIVPYPWALNADSRFVVVGDGHKCVRVLEDDKVVTTFNVDGASSLSLSGDFVAIGTAHTVFVANAANGGQLARFELPEPLGGISIGAKGRFLLTLSGQRAVENDTERAEETPWRARLFDVLQKKEMRLSDDQDVDDAILSQSGKLVAFAHKSRIDIFNLVDQIPVASFTLPGAKQLYNVTFSADERSLTVEQYDRPGLRLFDIGTGKELSWSGEKLRAVAYGRDSALIAIADDDGYVHLYEAATNKELWYVNEGTTVIAMTFSPDGRYLATGAKDNTARILDIESGREVSRLNHNASVDSVAFSPDNRHVATRSEDGTSRIFRARDGSEVARFVSGTPFGPVRFSNDSKYVGTGWNHGALFGVHDDNEEREIDLSTTSDSLMGVTFMSNGSGYAIGVQRPDTVQIFAPENSMRKEEFPGHNFAITPNARFFVTGGFDGIARLFDRSNGTELHRFLNPDLIAAVAISPDARYVATVMNSGRARIFGAAQMTEITHVDLPFAVGSNIAFMPDGRHFLAPSEDGISMYDTQKGSVTMTFTGASSPFTLSADGEQLAAVTDKDTVGIFQVKTGKQRIQVSDIAFGPHMSFSADGRSVAVGFSHLSEHSSEVVVLDVAKAKEVTRFNTRGELQALSFNTDGHFLLTASEARTNDKVLIRKARVFPKDLLADICSRVTRNLSRAEWAEFVGAAFYERTCPNLPTPPTVNASVAKPPAKPRTVDQELITAKNLTPPELISPTDRTVFTDYPRHTMLRWNAVAGAVSYDVEIEFCQATDAWIESGGDWCEGTSAPWEIVKGVTNTEISFGFVGANPGRWRVWAIDKDGKGGPKSEFRTFRYTQ